MAAPSYTLSPFGSSSFKPTPPAQSQQQQQQQQTFAPRPPSQVSSQPSFSLRLPPAVTQGGGSGFGSASAASASAPQHDAAAASSLVVAAAPEARFFYKVVAVSSHPFMQRHCLNVLRKNAGSIHSRVVVVFCVSGSFSALVRTATCRSTMGRRSTSWARRCGWI